MFRFFIDKKNIIKKNSLKILNFLTKIKHKQKSTNIFYTNTNVKNDKTKIIRFIYILTPLENKRLKLKVTFTPLGQRLRTISLISYGLYL